MMENFNSTLIFTDLDGTLLDHHDYNYRAAIPVLEKLELLKVPVIFNTSKTRAEIISLREKIGNKHPFIVENGSGIFIPNHYFQQESNINNTSGFDSICLGETRAQLLTWLETTAIHFSHCYSKFHDLTIEEIVNLTGLSKESAELANTREFSEPLHWIGTEKELEAFTALAIDHKLNVLVGGRFVHLLGKTNKGLATQTLANRYLQYGEKKSPTITSSTSQQTIIACGDGNNDIDMLEAADIAVIVKSPKNPAPVVNNEKQYLTNQTGPEGWASTIKEILTL
ncbi:MAG: HAD-IIB family hydrolase [Cellvibrionaceae bacterium]